MDRDCLFLNEETKYCKEIIWSTVSMVSDYNNENQLKDFYNWCNNSIIDYNQIAKYWQMKFNLKF